MANATIPRATFTDDTGDGISGDIWNSTRIGTSIYDKADALFDGTVDPFGINAALFIGDSTTANTFNTKGVTVNIGAATDEAIACQADAVVHGMTSLAMTDTFAQFRMHSSTQGGFTLRGYTEATVGINVNGRSTSDNTTKSTAGSAPVIINAQKKSGTSAGGVGADANLCVIQDDGTTRFIFDEDGDSHQDVGTAWTNFDDQDDLALLTTLSASVSRQGDPLRQQFGALLESHRESLEAQRLVTFNNDGRHFINWSRTHMATIGAVRQLGRMLSALCDEVGVDPAKIVEAAHGTR